MATLAVTRRFDPSDVQWQWLEPLLPVGKGPGRPSRWTKRQLIDAIRWRVRVGSPWRDVPECYGSWRAVYGLFRRWQRAGVWAAIMTGLQADADAAGLITWEVSVDSTIARAHQPGDSPQFQPVLEKIRVPRIGPGHPRRRPARVRADKAYGSRINRRKRHRAVATRYDKLAVRYEAIVQIAAISDWLTCLCDTP